AAADRVVAPLGGAGGTGFVSRWTAARNEVAEAVAAAVDADLRREGDAVARRDVAAISGWLTSRRPADVIEARSTNVSTGVADPLRNVVDESARSLDPGSRAAVYDVAGRIDDEVAA